MREDRSISFGKYELLDRLGAGGMATVYRARYTAAPSITKPVVIKRVLSQYAENPDFVEMFIHEARISVGLSHGNIVQVFDFGQVDGEYFLAMELVEGQPLSRVLKRAKGQGLEQLPQPLAASIAIEMCKGLHHAHTRTDERGQPLGLVHRDVSPDNILVSYDGEVKIADFGIAKAELAGRPVTGAGMVKGKYLFLSPEQARGLDLDARSDVYAVGVVLYRMLCGRLPIEGQDHEVMERIVRGEISSPGKLNPELDVQLSQIVMRALATSRGARFQSAEELQQALSRWLAMNAPLFTVSALKHLMGWLYAPELKELGRQPVLPQTFLSQVALWRRGESAAEPGAHSSLRTRTLPLADEEDASSRKTLLDASAITGLEQEEEREESSRREARPWTEAAPASSRRKSLGWALGAGAVALVLLMMFLVLGGPPPLEIHSEPPGAQVRLDGEVRGVTPLVLEGVARDEPHSVELLLLGWKSWRQEFQADALGTRMEAVLEELEAPVPAPTPVLAVAPAPAPEPEAAPPPAPEKGKGRPEPTKKEPPARLKGSGPRITVAAKPSPELATAKYRQGLKELSRGQLVNAKELFWECLANDPKAARCFRRLGEVSAQLGSTEEAVEYYSRFLEIDPHGDGSEDARTFIRQNRGKRGR